MGFIRTFNKCLFAFMLMLLLSACSKDNNPASINTINENGTVSLEELILLVNIKATDSTYLVVQSVDSVKIKINTLNWSITNSQSIDTSKIVKFSAGNTYQTHNKLNYLITARQDLPKIQFNTAGEYAQYLNASYEIKQGEYVCCIESFQLRFTDNSIKKFYPYAYQKVKIEKDTRSTFVGEIELKIY